MTTKKMTLGELLVNAATPRGKRKPFSAVASLNDRVAYLQHAVKQVSAGVAAAGLEASDVSRDVDVVDGWQRGPEETVTGRLQDMVNQLLADRDNITFDESDVELVFNDGVGVLAPLAGVFEVEAERDQADADVAQFQWYFVAMVGAQPLTDDDDDDDSRPRSAEAEAAIAEIEEIAAEIDQAEDDQADVFGDEPVDEGEATGEPEELPDWHGPRPNLDGDEVIRLAGVDYVRHPLSAAFVDLSDDEIAMLAASLKTGQRHSVVVIQDGETGVIQVVDGWQRMVALQTIEQEPFIEETTDGDDLARMVMALNEHRRGSTVATTTTRCIKAIELLDIERGGRGPRPSAKAVAAVAGCSTGTVEQIRRARKWDKEHKTDYFARMERGSLSASAANDQIAKAEQAAKQADDEPAEPKRTGVEYDIHGNKLSRRDLVDHLQGAEDQAKIDAELHAQAIAGEREKVAQARKAEQAAKERLDKLADSDETAKQVLSLEEQNAALKSQVKTLTERLSDALRDYKRASETVEAARTALRDGDRDDLYEALDVEMPDDGDEEVFA